MQLVYSVSTNYESLRAEIQGWGPSEDPRLFRLGKPIGSIPSGTFPLYKTVLEALADGWTLLSSPQAIGEGEVSWWLVKNVGN